MVHHDSVVYGDSDDLFVLCQNFTSNEDMTTSGECTFMNMLDTDFQGSCISSTMMHGTTNAYYYEHGMNMIINKQQPLLIYLMKSILLFVQWW